MPTTEPNKEEFDISLFLRRRWVVISTWLSAVIITAVITFSMRPVYQATAMLVIEKERSNNKISQGTGSATESSGDDYYQTQYKLLKSEALLQSVYQRLELDKAPGLSSIGGYQSLQGLVTVTPVPRTRLVYIKTEYTEPKLTAIIANTMADVFIEQNLSNQLFISKDVLAALQNERPDGQSRAIYESLPAVISDTLIQSLKQQISALDSQIAESSDRYTPRHPVMMAMAIKRETLQTQMKAETDRVIQSIKIDLSGQLMGNNIRLIDKAMTPQFPVKPRKALNMLLAAIGGLVLGLFAAVLTEFIDQTVRTQEDVENKLGLPFLGVVPLSTHYTQAVYNHMLRKEPSITSEAVRNLRTMIDFTEVAQANKSFIVTSTVQGEGKSFLAANIAVAMAQAGEKVLLIEGDMRRSNVHKMFHVPNPKGLSDFLATGTMEELPGLIQASEVKNLSLLVCGPHPPNPAELLNTPKLSSLLTWAKKEYFRVIVDCPPMFPLSDSLLWGKYIPGTIYTVAFAKTRIPLIKTGAKLLGAANVKILGAVINMAKAGGMSYYYGPEDYKYSYSYKADETGKKVKVEAHHERPASPVKPA